MTTDLPHLAGAFAAAFLAGAINSVAGGGTLISFPALIALGLPPVIANATNTVGIWPGSLGSMWALRAELQRVEKPLRLLLAPALLGGGAGAILLRLTPPGLFDHLVPWLILLATVLFIIQAPVQRRLKTIDAATHTSRAYKLTAIAVQLAVGIYGGYFGAGMSIMMLSVLGLLGMTDILEMSAMTSLLSCCINGIAGALFIAAGLISWPHALVMAAGAIIGGYGAVGVARKIGKPAIRRFVILMGITIATFMFYKLLHP